MSEPGGSPKAKCQVIVDVAGYLHEGVFMAKRKAVAGRSTNGAAKRELINTASDKRYVRRGAEGHRSGRQRLPLGW
jgi:hypothetical protein